MALAARVEKLEKKKDKLETELSLKKAVQTS
jgi:hypothetical protein